MAWTYNVTTLESSIKDQIRLRIGDTVEADPMIQDEEILYCITDNNSDIARTSLACVRIIITRLTSTPDYTLGPYSESNSNRLKALIALKEDFIKQVSGCDAPMMHSPTTSPIFSYDMMSKICCDRPDGEEII